MTTPNYELLRRAILAVRPVAFTYKGHRRLVCPHVLGTKKGLEHVLVYQYGGGSSSGLPPAGEWRCLHVSEAFDIEMIGDDWATGHNHSRPQTCVDRVDVQIWFRGDGTPYAQEA